MARHFEIVLLLNVHCMLTSTPRTISSFHDFSRDAGVAASQMQSVVNWKKLCPNQKTASLTAFL
jgi:hypothetical protein